jgi:tetratricopeptide (TPR) repeat protein
MTTPGIELIRRLYKEGKYSEILCYVDELLQKGYVTAELLVRKAMCLQLLDPPVGEFEEVERTFKAALDLDPKSTQALIEYGWYKLNVLDQASEALTLFRRALSLQAEMNTEVVTGILKCMEETSPGLPRQDSLSETVRSLVDLQKVNDYLDQ